MGSGGQHRCAGERLAGGVAAALGALVGGYVYDRMDKLAYCLFGILVGCVAVGMAYAPRTELMFAMFVLVYQFMTGGGYAGYAAIILEAIGKSPPPPTSRDGGARQHADRGDDHLRRLDAR